MSEESVVRRHVWISGRVQGVFFRSACAQEAKRRDVQGWVRNNADGRVEAVFEGPDSLTREMFAWCHVGPPRASVTNVETQLEEPIGEVGFRVR